MVIMPAPKVTRAEETVRLQRGVKTKEAKTEVKYYGKQKQTYQMT